MRLSKLSAATAIAVAALTVGTVAAAVPSGAVSARHASPTQEIVIRPVTTHGHVAAGFTRVDLDGHKQYPVDCSYPEPSDVAVDKGIFYCAPTAAYAQACWAAARAHRVLCYWSPFSKRVVRFRGDAPAKAVHPSSPHAALAIVLDNGERCRLRDGGAWSAPTEHPKWVGYYFCDRHGDNVWGSRRLASTAGTNRSGPRWFVHVGTGEGHLAIRKVVKAYYVGTAGA